MSVAAILDIIGDRGKQHAERAGKWKSGDGQAERMKSLGPTTCKG
jgi:hypothetical protein